MSSATLTEFLRHPKDVIERVREEGQVRLTRRGDADLVIVRGDELDALRDGAALASRIGRAAARNGGDVREGLRSLFAWTSLLSAAELGDYAQEVERLVYASAETGRYGALLQAQAGWAGTAEAYAAGLGPAPVEATGATPVERP
ncbi:MAG: type II toxin-antitoxin system prevent-host-death family antitoxin [Bifidobacteriaceae bacterium]|jgi:prevent-host-death family protein|nr:type II toxin-antitoxin system prevent-host-death family antitoxin [Bifidobacteriaceae bacterium]